MEAFGAPLPGSEIVRDLSENDFCSRTSERAEKTWFTKSVLPCFFLLTKRMKEKVQKSVMFVEDEAESRIWVDGVQWTRVSSKPYTTPSPKLCGLLSRRTVPAPNY